MDNQKRIHAFTDNILGTSDAIELSNRIQSKDISIDEVLRATIERAKFVNPLLNAIEFENFEQILKSPTFKPNQIFSAIPTFIKDNLDLIGFPTQQGSTSFKSKEKIKNSKITQQMLDTGLIALGKSKMPEFGLNASTEFKSGDYTRNPWHTDYSCGASSGGAAALVASGVVPIAHANDGGGSIRIPAANCGLVGLKPTRGRWYPNEGSQYLPIDLVSDGVLTRSVRDTAFFFTEMEEQYKPKKLPEMGLIQHPSNKPLRIGLVYDSLQTNTDAETRQTVESTAQLLRNLGHHIEEFSLPIPDSFVDDFSHYWGFLSYMIQQFGKPLLGKDFNVNELDHLTVGLANLYKKNFYKTPLFLYRLKQIQRIYQQIFQQYDVILSPVLAHVSPQIGYLSPQLEFNVLFERLRNYVAFTPIQNIAGAPAISLPMGMTKLDSRPIGIQLSADLGQERLLIDLAYQLEQIQPFKKIFD